MLDDDYVERTRKELRAFLRWWQRTFRMRDWSVLLFLDAAARAETPSDEFPDQTAAQVLTRPIRQTADIYLDRLACQTNNRDPLRCLAHELAHVLFRSTGALAGSGDCTPEEHAAWERATERFGLALFLAWEATCASAST